MFTFLFYEELHALIINYIVSFVDMVIFAPISIVSKSAR